MVTLLKGLLGKTKRPLIVNGKLLLIGRNMLAISLVKYHIEFSVLGANSSFTKEQGTILIEQRIKTFEDNYMGFALQQGLAIDTTKVDAYVDPYMGAVVIESALYKAISSENMHEVGVQLSPGVAKYVAQFVTEYTRNYVDVYMYLLNRRVTSAHAPIEIRSHFVAGFFQPLVVETQSMRSPLHLGLNSWFLGFFQNYEKYLERAVDSNRKLELSCVAMCDIASIFGTGVVPELDKREWVLMCYMAILPTLSEEASLDLTKYYGYLFGHIAGDDNRRRLAAAVINYSNKSRTAVRVR